MLSKFFPWFLRESVFRASVFRIIILKFSKGKELPASGETKGGIGKEEDLKTPVRSKFLSPVPRVWVGKSMPIEER